MTTIENWTQFTLEVRTKSGELLKRLDEFPDAVLVTGCQRSGTTMLSRIITQSKGMVNYWFGQDDELDAALILSGQVEHEPRGRYCFQTTYLDERFQEYLRHSGSFKIVWVLRNPYSVVYSLIYNWDRRSLDDTFMRCGASTLEGIDTLRFKLMGIRGIEVLRRACAVFNAKTSQLFQIYPYLGPEKIMVIDYDVFVTKKHIVLPKIYQFLDIAYLPKYSDGIHSQSLTKSKGLTRRELNVICRVSLPIYIKAKHYVSKVSIDTIEQISSSEI